MYYRPRLSDGRLAPLPWQIRLFFFNADWPLNDNPTLFQQLIINLALILEFGSLIVIVEAEFNYMRINSDNLGLVLETLLTSMISFEIFLRALNMTLKRDEFKQLITDFYAKIYIERTSDNIALYDELQRRSIPTRICSYTYFMTLFTYFTIPIIGFFSNQLLFPYQMIPHYDYHPLPIYIPTLFAAIWDGVLVVTHLVAEANTMAALILNLNGRYLMLQRELHELYTRLKDKQVAKEQLIPQYYEGLVRIIRQNYKLNLFASQMQKQYSFRIFVMMGLSAITLCVLSFKIVTLGFSTKIITYILWICTKIVELIVFGEIGSRIIETTNQMSVAYYHSKWEDVILDSENARDNVKVMKLIAMAIELNQKPIYFTGFNFFRVSLTTVLTIIQGAGSYFTCLYAFS